MPEDLAQYDELQPALVQLVEEATKRPWRRGARHSGSNRCPRPIGGVGPDRIPYEGNFFKPEGS